ncbi:MAG: hypothetical protein IKL68_05545 [Clostridia bacterium]|nr:hypothetical protein [Clostridia bacterium]
MESTINDEINSINSMIENIKKSKSLFSSYMDKISCEINNIENLQNTDEFHNCVEKIKLNIENTSELDTTLNNLIGTLNNLKKEADVQRVVAYNRLYKDVFKKYLDINNNVCDFLNDISHFMTVTFKESVEQKELETIAQEPEISTVIIPQDIKENTLIISEKKQSVILPFTISELNEVLCNNPNEYSSIENVIDTIYTKPLSTFKNAPFSRFKESLNLIKDREHGNLKQAFDLGLELFFNTNLHPAVISACKNLDELDIYLDCLENGETDKFKCFNILFEVAPLVIKDKRSQIL